jgi:hypothetical protein
LLRFKEGQRVKVVKNPSYHGGENGHTWYIEEKNKWKGQMVTIVRSRDCGCCYEIKDDNGQYSWADEWLVPLDDEIIEIKNESAMLVHIVPGKNGGLRKIERQVKVADLIERLTQEKDTERIVETPILPSGTKFYQKIGETEVVIVEQPPQVRTILVSEDRKFALAFPYIIYLIYLAEGGIPDYKSRMFYRNSPLETFNDKLFLSNLTHVNMNKRHEEGIGSICLYANFVNSSEDLTTKVNRKLQGYWETKFDYMNDGGGSYFDGFMKAKEVDPRIANLDAWQTASRLDPLFVLEIPWIDSEKTAGEILKDMTQEARKYQGKSEAKTIKNADQLAGIMYRIKEEEVTSNV